MADSSRFDNLADPEDADSGRFASLADPEGANGSRFASLADPEDRAGALERRILDGTYAADAQALALAFLDYLEQRTPD